MRIKPFFQPAPAVIETCTGQSERGSRFQSRHAFGRFLPDAHKHARLLAQTDEEFRAERRIGIGEQNAAMCENVKQPPSHHMRRPCGLRITLVALDPLQDEGLLASNARGVTARGRPAAAAPRKTVQRLQAHAGTRRRAFSNMLPSRTSSAFRPRDGNAHAAALPHPPAAAAMHRRDETDDTRSEIRPLQREAAIKPVAPQRNAKRPRNAMPFGKRHFRNERRRRRDSRLPPLHLIILSPQRGDR